MNTKDEAMEAAELAKVFHETYERLAPTFGYATRIESAKPWEQVPPTNKDLMVAVCQEIISKHFPEPSVPVSELKEMLSMEWMQNKTDVEQLQKHLEAIAWRPDGRGDPECVDQAAAMSNDVIRLLLLPLIDKIAKASAQEKP